MEQYSGRASSFLGAQEMDYGASCTFFTGITSSLPNSSQSLPNSSTGCCARSEPLPQYIESTAQYLSHPQQIRSGCAGCIGIFLAISRSFKFGNRTTVLFLLQGYPSSCENKSRQASLYPTIKLAPFWSGRLHGSASISLARINASEVRYTLTLQ